MSRDLWIVLGGAVYLAALSGYWCLVASGSRPVPAPRQAPAKPRRDDGLAAHRDPDCTGTWRVMEDDPCLALCTHCCACACGRYEVRRALDENRRGRKLLEATARGALELDADRKRKELAA
jgi:hypothetical protein